MPNFHTSGEDNESSEPLLVSPADSQSATDDATVRSGESFDDVPQEKRQLGLVSAVALIFNRMIGTGIYATPSVILRSAGSPGLALCMWILGATVATAGTAVYIEFGTGLPRSGGEKNYLEFLYKRPRFLATCVYAMYMMILGWSAANAIVFGEYIIHALGVTPSTYNIRFIAFCCLTLCFIMHSVFMKWGVRLQNILGFFKLFVLLGIGMIGVFHLVGMPGFQLQEGVETPHNLEWSTMWKGSGNGAVAFVTGLYNIIWSFTGYSNANYALSEIRDPVRTIKKAAPLALLGVTIIYILINIAYFAVVSKNDILGSGRVVAALFFRNMFGSSAEKLLSIIIALSILGNCLTALFTRGRVVQELGREGIVPHSSFFASNKPFGSPMPGIFWQWFVSSIYIIAPPPGDAYLFMLNLTSYPEALINTFLSAGLLFLHIRKDAYDWSPPFRAYKVVVWFFFTSNLLLITVPLMPPANNFRVYENIPYFLHVLIALTIGLIGVAYWYVYFIWIPRRSGYRIDQETVVQEDGVSRKVFRKVAL